MNRTFDDSVTVYLAIESVELSSSDLTSRLGMRPDREWSLGDARGKTGKRWESHGWVVQTSVRSEDSGGRPASELIPIALDRFEARVKAFAKGASLLGDSTPRYVVLGILAEEAPGIELGRSFLRLLAELGGTFQVDLNVQVPTVLAESTVTQ
jgi:hypothetical protein